MRELMFSQAENQAFDEEMQRDPTVFVMGEDIGLYWGGPFGQFRGLIEKYGPKRIRETPISEKAILGGAIGAAAAGMRPCASMMFVDFLGCAFDEMINQLQMRYMFGGKIKLPLTILAGIGAGRSTIYSRARRKRSTPLLFERRWRSMTKRWWLSIGWATPCHSRR